MPEAKHQRMPSDEHGRIVIEVLPGGRVRLSSTIRGRPDSAYAPMAQERLAVEVPRLLAELRGRAREISPK